MIWFILYISLYIFSLKFTSVSGIKRITIENVVFDDAIQTLKSKSKSVVFNNNYLHPITVYWIDTESDPIRAVKIKDVAPGHFLNATTFDSHLFSAMVNGTSEATPRMIEILNGVETYEFGPVFTSRDSLHPAVHSLNNVVRNVRFKVKSLVSPSISIWSEDEDGALRLIVREVALGKEEYLNTYEGVTFVFTPTHDEYKILGETTVTRNHSLIVVEDASQPASSKLRRQTAKQVEFHEQYLQRNGIPWNMFFDVGSLKPRPPVTLFNWPATRVGDTHKLHSKEGFWSCAGSVKQCQSSLPVPLQLEAVSVAPKVFVVPNFVSDYEIQVIQKLAAPQLQESFIGSGKFEKQRKSETRTSRNAWVHRISGSPVTESLFRRAADLLQLDEALLHRHVTAEDLQVVHYNQGEKYDGHYDWSNSGYPQTRFATVLIYMSNQTDTQAGGETAFLKANNRQGFKVHPGKGSAVLFYNLLADGNGDDLAFHSALPVLKGEKWLANFWVWDPKFH